MTDAAATIDFNRRRVAITRSVHGYGFTHIALRSFAPGEVVMQGYGRRVSAQTRHCSIQLGAATHIIPTKWTGRYWNHSCAPNTYCHTRTNGYPELVALHPIARGDEVTYSYATSEYVWQPNADEVRIRCRCGARTCKGVIRSFSQLSLPEQRRLVCEGRLSAHLSARATAAIADARSVAPAGATRGTLRSRARARPRRPKSPTTWQAP